MQKNQGINFLGRVVDQQKQAPISGAKVLLNFSGAPPVVYTDLEGIYRFTVKPNSNSSLQGQITIEAKGYRSHESSIKLLPDKRDLGDIRLLQSDSEVMTPTSSTESSSMLIPMIVALMTVLAITVVVSTKHLAPQEIPLEIPVTPQKIRVKHHRKYKDNSLSGNTNSFAIVTDKSNKCIAILGILSESDVINKFLKPLKYGYTEQLQKLVGSAHPTGLNILFFSEDD